MRLYLIKEPPQLHGQRLKNEIAEALGVGRNEVSVAYNPDKSVVEVVAPNGEENDNDQTDAIERVVAAHSGVLDEQTKTRMDALSSLQTLMPQIESMPEQSKNAVVKAVLALVKLQTTRPLQYDD